VSDLRPFHNIALIGFMGSGKSSVGRMLAAQLKFEFMDTDDLIERRAGRTITEIFDRDGEARFRQFERELVEQMVSWRRKVISTGGGLGASQENLISLKHHSLVVCLWASPEQIWRRVSRQSHRPLLHDPDPLMKIQTLLAIRRPFYVQADVLISSDNRSVREVTSHILHEFRLVRQHLGHETPDPTTRR
jgi:shikimate kinase